MTDPTIPTAPEWGPYRVEPDPMYPSVVTVVGPSISEPIGLESNAEAYEKAAELNQAYLAGQRSTAGALRRADKLVYFMSRYISKMAPERYGDLYFDLNEHFLEVPGLLASLDAEEGK